MTIDALNDDGTVYLAGTGRGPEGRSMLFRNPLRVLRARTPDEVPGVLAALDAAVAERHYVAGFVSYDAGETGRADPPCAWFGVYADVEEVGPPSEWASEASVGPLSPRGGRDAFVQGVRDVRHLIHEGDVYQINFTTQFEGEARGSGPDIFAHVWRQQPVPFGACLCVDGMHILSWSPELFFRRDGQRMTTRPMKGTLARGRTGREDADNRQRLAADEKNRAENLMIVDLLRNDLSMVCEPGSVTVPSLFEVETYPSVLQMTSTVEGTLVPDATYASIFQAMFPCGSVTGAPKRRAMQRIAELETGARGVYCGSIGYVAPGGEARFNVAIRTAVVQDGRFRLGAGAGIVWDSDPEAEFEETLLKTSFLHRRTPSFRLLETMRVTIQRHPREAGLPELGISLWDVPLWDKHMARLSASVFYFGWDVDTQRLPKEVQKAIAPALKTYIYNIKAGKISTEKYSDIRVRVTVGGAGDVEVSLSAAPAPPSRPVTVGLSTVRVDSEDLFLFHKTTHRPLYDLARQVADKHGWYDALLVNEHGCITEGSITNVFIRNGDTWSTPPVADGLLGGVSRAAFMEARKADGVAVRERSLVAADLAAADEVMVTNAVLGSATAEFIHG